MCGVFAAMLIKSWFYLGRKADVIYSFSSWREPANVVSIFLYVYR